LIEKYLNKYSKMLLECKSTYPVPVASKYMNFVEHFWLVDVFECELTHFSFSSNLFSGLKPVSPEHVVVRRKLYQLLPTSTGDGFCFETSISTLKGIANMLINVKKRVRLPYRCCC
jgi:hypothetical protein